MPRHDGEPNLVPSLLDRLIDDEPRISSEPEAKRSATLAQLKASVRRDLEWLLNTKRLLVAIPALSTEIGDSVLAYGLPDFTHASFGLLDDQRELRRVIEEAVLRFEPRLTQVRVTLLEGNPNDRHLRFRIDAMLDIEPTPEVVTFDSVLQMPARSIVVQDS